jgi:methylmalonyl-CoA epimerase
VKIKRIEHVGIVVADLERSRALWEDVLGVRLGGIEHLAPNEVRIAMYPIGASMVELLSGTTPDGKYARLVRERGEGLHHICLEVEDIDGALAELRAKRVRLLDETPRLGHAGSRIVFLDPASTNNLLVELVELPGGGHRPQGEPG